MKRTTVVRVISIPALFLVLMATCTKTVSTGPSPILVLSPDTLSFKMIKDHHPPDSQVVTAREPKGAALPDSLIAGIAYDGPNVGWDSIDIVRLDDSTVSIVNHLRAGTLDSGVYLATIAIGPPGRLEEGHYSVSLEIGAGLVFGVVSKPIAGYEDSVDAVTKATDIAGSIGVLVEPPVDPTDSIKDVRVDFGEGDHYNKLNGTFPAGPDTVTIAVWFVRPDSTVLPVTVPFVCTTSVSVTTYKGFSADTSIITRILAKGQH